MILREQWISFLNKLATGPRKTRALLTPIGILFFLVFTALYVFSGIVADRLLDLPDFLPESTSLALAISNILTGSIVTVWSALHFIRANGTPVPVNPPSKLVKTGPYRYVRNPMITGIFLILFGIGFGLNSVSLVFVFAPLYVMTNVWEIKRIEEPELIRRLHDEYLEYRQQTPMFLPGWKVRKMTCV